MKQAKVVAQRVKEAREGRGLTQAELARRLGCKSHSSIVAIEQGSKDLKMGELLKIAEALNVPPASLYSDEKIGALTSPQFLWRQKAKDPEAVSREQDKIRQHCENYRLLERLVDSHSLPPRELPTRAFCIHEATYETAKELADDVNRTMGLGDYPADLLARRLEEEFGVIILRRPLDNGSAVCSRLDGSIAIVLNEKEPPWRQVFSLAHELFHIVTWSDPLVKKVYEDDSLFKKNELLADEFAAALLMPLQMIERDLRDQKLSYSIIVALTRKYKVSAQAMLWRLCHARLLPKETVQKTLEDAEFKKLDQSTRRTAIASDSSFGDKFVRLAYLAFEKGKVSKSRLARMLNVRCLAELKAYLAAHGFGLTDDKKIVSSAV